MPDGMGWRIKWRNPRESSDNFILGIGPPTLLYFRIKTGFLLDSTGYRYNVCLVYQPK
jgi:hypothetical protein